MPKPALIVSTRVISGAVGAVIAVVTLVAAATLPIPTIRLAPAAIEVTPVPTPAALVCPGAVLRLGDASGANASSAIAIGRPQYSTASTSSAVSVAHLTAEGSEATGGEPLLVTGGDTVSNIAAAQVQRLDSDDYRGLAAAECTTPSSDTWLVGGSTSVGRTTLLTLANPGSAPSTVEITIASTEGLVDAPGLTGITVPANSQRTMSLAGFAPDVATLVVHVTSRGGPVAAALQESIVRGIEPGGVDIIGGGAVPSTVTVVPGIVISGTEAIGSRLGEPGFDDLLTALRIYAPGDAEGQATVRVVSEDGVAGGASFELALQAGEVTDIPIEGLVDGTYSMIIETTVPVVAAVRASTVAGDPELGAESPSGGSDVAWFASATAIGDAAYASVAPTDGAQLHFANPGDAAITVTLNGASVSVPAGGAVAIPATAGLSYLIEGGTGLSASISFVQNGGLASYLISARATVEQPVTIYP